MVERGASHENERWSGLAIAGFVLSLLFYTALLGLIFSAIGLSMTSDGKKKGRGLAIAGLIIGIVFTVMFFIMVAVGVSLLGSL